MTNVEVKALELSKKHGGKIEVNSKIPVTNMNDLAAAYSPGVAAVSKAIAENKEDVYTYTSKKNTVAIVTDGSAVLGLGNIGPEAAIPVMEGKAVLFKEFADVDAFPISLNTQDADEIVSHIKAIAPSFGGINLEDIGAPRCFEIERRLQEELDIPVFHDDQHGTAIVTLAALYNSLKLVKKNIEDIKVVINGAGAAGQAIGRKLLLAGVKDILMVGRKGIISEDDPEVRSDHVEISTLTNRDFKKGSLHDALQGADVFIGVSSPGVLDKTWIKDMAGQPIIFAMANPDPEITPEDAKEGGAYIIGTGRSDYPNQINNVLAFPGIFRGALDSRAKKISDEMQIAAAKGIADVIPESELTPDYIIPNVFHEDVSRIVAESVRKTALQEKEEQ